MYCPNCHTLCDESDRFCYLCGTALQTEAPKPRKGSLWIPTIILLFMTVVGLVTFFATAGTQRAVHTDGSSPWFYVKNGILYFEEHRYDGSSELTVPSEIAGQTVLALSEECFANCTTLTTVYLPDTIASIGDGAFSGCTSLRGIFIPASVNMIGEEAFYGCTALEAIVIHNRIKIIREDAFDQCNHLNYIFFLGTKKEWTGLYDEFINRNTGVFCADGSFYQGGNPYE